MPKQAIVAALVGLVLAAAPASASTSEFGHTGSRDRVLKQSCHNYRYHFVVKAPTNDWTLETFLVDPTGDTLASGAFSSESENDRDHGRFRICRTNTVPGRFTIRAKLTWYRGSEEHTVWFKPSHFRLRAGS
ncbi:MAG: hypothetical protein JWN22_1188 [Nocardioides sp.]|jgi:hypothetical protein|nr:hypothetical protein [Nocardioides sp.]